MADSGLRWPTRMLVPMLAVIASRLIASVRASTPGSARPDAWGCSSKPVRVFSAASGLSRKG